MKVFKESRYERITAQPTLSESQEFSLHFTRIEGPQIYQSENQ
jgi:hypothetical protein